MAAIKFRIAVLTTGGFAAPMLTSEQLRYIGLGMVDAQKNRWAHALNTSDAPAKPLSNVGAKGKVRFGQPMVRNMKMTGLMTDNFQLRRADSMFIRAENSTRMARLHAKRAQSYEDMIGFAPSDEKTIFDLANREYGIYLERAWRPKR